MRYSRYTLFPDGIAGVRLSMKFNVPQLPIENPLLRHLVWIGIIKIILLYCLWFAFFRDREVHVDPQSAAQRILYPASNSNTNSTDEDNQP